MQRGQRWRYRIPNSPTPGSVAPRPQQEQTALPPEVTYQDPQAGFSYGHLLDVRAELRVKHPADERHDVVPIIEGKHPQRFGNFAFVANAVSQLLVPFNPLRAYIIVQNKSPNVVHLGFDRAADPDSGLDVAPATAPGLGGNYEPILGTISSVHVLAPAGDSLLCCVEGFYNVELVKVPRDHLPDGRAPDVPSGTAPLSPAATTIVLGTGGGSSRWKRR